MSSPFDLVISRLEQYGVRVHGDRARAACPSCGGRSKNTLSVGRMADDVVLLKCFKFGCDIDAITGALGLTPSGLFPPRTRPGGGTSPVKRRALLPAAQALDLLHAEANVVAVAAGNVAHGVVLTDEDRQRVLQAAGRIAALREEAKS